jgi:5-formyltetrahydrofolate cyclo-ligase
MAERRERLSSPERARLSAAATARLIDLPELAPARAAGKTVSGYVALDGKGELDPALALVECRARGACVVLPRVSAQVPRLRFHRSDDATPPPGPAGRFGLIEPDASAPEVAVEAIDIVILPGLAFDRAGNRLGYGGGYYDEVAGRLRAGGHGLLVGLGYDFQLVDRCPAGAGDVTVDCVVTDRQVVRCDRERGAA